MFDMCWNLLIIIFKLEKKKLFPWVRLTLRELIATGTCALEFLKKKGEAHTHFYLKSDELLAGSYPTKSGQGGVRESRFLTDTVDF